MEKGYIYILKKGFQFGLPKTVEAYGDVWSGSSFPGFPAHGRQEEKKPAVSLDLSLFLVVAPWNFDMGKRWKKQHSTKSIRYQNEALQLWSQFMEVHPGRNHVHYWAPLQMWNVAVSTNWSTPSLIVRWHHTGEHPASEIEVFCGRDLFSGAFGMFPQKNLSYGNEN